MKISLVVLTIVLFSVPPQVTAQTQRGSRTSSGSASDLSAMDFRRMKVEDLTDEQIEEVLAQADEQGLTMNEIERMALARGLKPSEVVKLRLRLRRARQANPARSTSPSFTSRASAMRRAESTIRGTTDVLSALSPGRRSESETGEWPEDSLSSEYLAGLDSLGLDDLIEDELPVFGEDLFASEALTFEPSLDLPTPADYRLGPGDELVIDVWGAAEMTYDVSVSREGSVRLENIGPIQVAGLSIDDARRRIIGRLSTIYSGLNASGGGQASVFADVSLGRMRTISVHILGEVTTPGTYALPSMATVLNALYACAGPGENGTYRRIQVVRDGGVITELDIYTFLVHGRLEGNIQLRDQDIIKVDPYIARVQIEGEVKRPARYEILPGETLEDLVRFAGSFTGQAYSRRLSVRSTTDTERRIESVEYDAFRSYRLKGGDEIVVSPLLERFENRVEIQGAVFRDGEYQLEQAPTVASLIRAAEGLRGDAFRPRAQIFRTRPDFTLEVIPFDLGRLSDNPESFDLPLVKDDVVLITSIFDLQEERLVLVQGSVQKQGPYAFVEGMTLKDVLVMAGGLKEEAYHSRVEVSRRRNTPEAAEAGSIAEIFYLNVDEDLSVSGVDPPFYLQPFDEVFVRRSPDYFEQRDVTVQGEVQFPGIFTLQSKKDRVSDLIARAGGLTAEAYPRGARLVRRREGIGAVGIDLPRILAAPGSEYDLLVEHGDSIHIPLRLETVKVSGAIHYPVSVRHSAGLSFRDYVSRAGGPIDRADLGKAYVVNANGSVDRVRGGLFARYPDVEPGAEIVIPLKPDEEKMSRQERVLILSSIVSIAAVVSTTLFQLTR